MVRAIAECRRITRHSCEFSRVHVFEDAQYSHRLVFPLVNRHIKEILQGRIGWRLDHCAGQVVAGAVRGKVILNIMSLWG